MLQTGETLNYWPLVIIILLAAVALLWWLIRRSRSGDPTFPIPRPDSNYVEAPRRDVVIKVRRSPNGGQELELVGGGTITPNEQLAWSGGPTNAAGKGLRVEIRFPPNRTPFRADKFITAAGGTILSGLPDGNAVGQSFDYLLLVTTGDGDLVADRATVAVTSATGRAA